MSLIHWWPLNGNTNDYGINNIALINNGATVNSVGKIGKCYSFNNNNMVVATSDITSAVELSLCLWLKLSTSHSGYAQVLVLGTSGTSWNNIRCGIDISGDGRIYFNVSNGSTNTLIYSPLNYKDNIWHHITGIYNNGSLQLYIDGIQVAAGTTTTVPGLSGTSIYVGGNAGGEKANNGDCLNDVRIYNHALSTKEVKEISKGLVLHYNFEDEYIEPTTNIDPARSTAPSFSYAATKEKVIFKGKECWHFIIENNGSIWSYSSANGYAENSVLTRSCWLYIPSGQTNRAGWYGLPFAFEGMKSISNRRVYDLNKMDTWQYCYCTGTAQSTSSNYLLYMLADGSATAHRIEFYITDIQLEEKDHATPYVNGTRSAGKVYDSSGYGNNGTISSDSTFKISSTTVSGRHSGQFDGTATSFINAGQGAKLTDEITVSWFGCMTNWANYGRAISCTEGGGWNFEPANSKMQWSIYLAGIGYKTCQSIKNLSEFTSGWHLFTGTYDGFTSKLYIDGELQSSVTSGATAKTAIGYSTSNSIFIGAEATESATTPTSPYFSGNIADFKIYSKALSAEDIKAEYNRKAAIDRNGSLFTGEIIETINNLLTTENLFNGRVNTSTTNVGEIVTRNGYSAYRLGPIAYWSGDTSTSKNICKGQFGSGQYIFDLWIDVDDVYYDGNGRWVPGGFEVYYTDGSVENVIVDANSTQGHSGYQHLIRKTNANKTISGLGVYYYIDVPVYIRCDSVICKVNSDGKICKNNIIVGGQFVEPAVSDSKCKLTRYGVVSNAIKEL